eukprot:TRINITY_DN6847_c1_g1_i2.p1 TRINITY_DN6847_c1_g1~~TRINITY_DN6847_c1_g1_i2.p1  ORF type:complete len:176 (-),score=17.27 TRINITY_DN6847_c1_g1_i2:10-537(-)
MRNYYSKNKTRIRESKFRYNQRSEVRNRRNLSYKQYYERNREKRREYVKEYLNRKKLEVYALIPTLRECVEDVLQISDPADWYRISLSQLIKLPEIGKYFQHVKLNEFLRTRESHSNNKPPSLPPPKVAYPGLHWKIKNFKLNRDHWNDPRVLREYLISIAPALGVQRLEDCYWE